MRGGLAVRITSMKAVLTTKLGSGYKDVVEERYHFPKTYLRQVERAVDDLIVYYEPRRSAGNNAGGRQAYFAVARIRGVLPDFEQVDHFYALVDSYLDFDRPVPFRDGSRYFETSLEREDGQTNKGAFGRSVRNISDSEFDSILREGFLPDTETLPKVDLALGLAEAPAEYERPIVQTTISRPFRDRAFARHIQEAYSSTCAVTGLRIINGGGRSEAQAAHIQPVAANGPDSIRNGLALAGTVHWMFDRGLMSVADNYDILVATDLVPDAAR